LPIIYNINIIIFSCYFNIKRLV